MAESEDEEFTVRKVSKKSKKETKKLEKKRKTPPPPPPTSKRDKLTSKPAKAKPPASGILQEIFSLTELCLSVIKEQLRVHSNSFKMF